MFYNNVAKRGKKMPLVRIEILKGKSQEYKKALLDAVHDALELSLIHI